METKQWTFVDKSKWSRGKWDGEPDKMQWTDEATGLPCLIHRGPSGALCGYVGVAEGHPAFGLEYDSVRVKAPEDSDDEYPDVHGGLTFSDFCSPEVTDEGRGICHVAGPGEPDRVWWLGFDCAHGWDFCPSYASARELRSDETYRDLAYVQWQCRKLAAQLAA